MRRVTGMALCSLLLLLIAGNSRAEVFFEQPDFQQTGRQAARINVPILVLFSATDCDYCLFVKEEFLAPMLKNSDYSRRVIIRVVDIDKADYLRDFNGKWVYPDELADRYDVQLTPTVAFLDRHGRELAERVIGIGTVDYYGGLLDEAIASSQRQINPD